MLLLSSKIFFCLFQVHEDIILSFFLEVFMFKSLVEAFMFSSRIQLEFISVIWCEVSVTVLSFSCLLIQFFQDKLLKIFYFPQEMALDSLLKINWKRSVGPFLHTVFWFIDLFVYPYVNATLSWFLQLPKSWGQLVFVLQICSATKLF